MCRVEYLGTSCNSPCFAELLRVRAKQCSIILRCQMKMEKHGDLRSGDWGSDLDLAGDGWGCGEADFSRGSMVSLEDR